MDGRNKSGHDDVATRWAKMRIAARWAGHDGGAMLLCQTENCWPAHVAVGRTRRRGGATPAVVRLTAALIAAGVCVGGRLLFLAAAVSGTVAAATVCEGESLPFRAVAVGGMVAVRVDRRTLFGADPCGPAADGSG